MAKSNCVKVAYERPVVVKEKRMVFPLTILVNGKSMGCKQCSSCHGCR